jgi:Family of unknown function (DUF6208)
MGRADRSSSPVPLLWELPVALASWLLYRLVRLVLGMRLLLRSRRVEKSSLLAWRVLSRDLLARRGSLEQILIGPRWNTAALNTAAGPFAVAGRLQLDREALDGAAELWSMMVYAVPSLLAGPSVRLARHLTRFSVPPGGALLTLELAPGRYWISVRFYCWRGPVTLPRIWEDGTPVSEPVVAPADANDFYDDLRLQTSWFLTALQCHSYLMVKWRRFLPRRLVERMLLPVGDPETEYRYGALNTGEGLAIEMAAAALATHLVFYTAYNRASLPVAWLRMEAPRLEAPRAAEPCVYLLRILHLHGRPEAGTGEPAGGECGAAAVRLAVLPPAP